jgi:hypothetical protein
VHVVDGEQSIAEVADACLGLVRPLLTPRG